MSLSLHQQLIERVSPEGREVYADTLEDLSKVTGRVGHIDSIMIRIIKGIAQLEIPGRMVRRIFRHPYWLRKRVKQ